jgi:hypothetical protein
MHDSTNHLHSAKYIEGLENRLGRMESLLRLSGLLSEDDAGATDLGTLEKRLADKTAELGKEGSSSKRNSGTPGPQKDGSASANGTPRPAVASPAASQSTSPEPTKSGKGEGEVEALSDMMCSLVTNNCGETRYIGMYSVTVSTSYVYANTPQGHHLDSRFSPLRAFIG